jgi:hypothetical protein
MNMDISKVGTDNSMSTATLVSACALRHMLAQTSSELKRRQCTNERILKFFALINARSASKNVPSAPQSND